MSCVHDALAQGTTLKAIPETGGTILVCAICGSGARFNMNGDQVACIVKPREDSPQLRIAEFEQQSNPPTWVCGWANTHPVGSICACGALAP